MANVATASAPAWLLLNFRPRRIYTSRVRRHAYCLVDAVLEISSLLEDRKRPLLRCAYMVKVHGKGAWPRDVLVHEDAAGLPADRSPRVKSSLGSTAVTAQEMDKNGHDA